uniref:Uncharacterized protein n=2 Tax=Cacopsylla melanoneura TaxID=428564 RepID=A0A8D8Z6Q3_9HEMI
MNFGNITMEALWDRLGSMGTQNAEHHSMVSNKLDNIQKNFDSVTGVLNDHSNQLGSLDYDKRRKNVVIFGVSEDQNDLENVVLSLFCTHMKINGFSLMELDFCRRLGKHPNHVKPRPILVGLTTQRRKIEILKNSTTLKGTPIFVKQDLSIGARETHKKLREERNNLRSQGKNAVIRNGQVICNENYAPRHGFAHTTTTVSSRNASKRALSQSPSDILETQKSAVKKTNQNISEGSDLLNTTMIELEENQHQDNRDIFSDTSSDFATPAQSPRPSITSPRNLLQPSIVPYLNTQQGPSEKNE